MDDVSALPSSNNLSTITNLRVALASLQVALDEANDELSRVRSENSKLKAAALGPASGPPKKNKRITVSTPLDYANDLLTIANQFTLLDFVWVKATAFQSPCPPLPIPIEVRYSDDASILLHIRYRLYQCVPEIYHGYLEALTEFGTNFNKLAAQQRSNLISKLNTSVRAIFEVAYPEITSELWNNPQERGKSELCRQLYMPAGQKFEPLLAPVIYSQGVVDIDGIFENEVLFSIGICLLFGHTAIRGKKPKNSHGIKWGIKSVTSGLISLCCIAAIYLVSNDAYFEEVGSKSNINYGLAFIAYKQRIEMHQNTPRIQKIIKIWNIKLFGEDPSDAEQFDFAGSNIDPRLAAIDAALAETPSASPPISVISEISHGTSNPTSMLLNPTLQPADTQLSSASRVYQSQPTGAPRAVMNSSHAVISTISNSHLGSTLTLPASTPQSVLVLNHDDSDDSSDESSDDQHGILLGAEPARSQPPISTAHIFPLSTSTVSTHAVVVPSIMAPDLIPHDQLNVADPGPVRGRGRPRGRGKGQINVGGRGKPQTKAGNTTVTRRSTRNQPQ